MSQPKPETPTLRERLEALSLANLLYYALHGGKPSSGNINWTLESQS